MGTSDFAADSLKALFNAQHEICGVFTRVDKPAGRKMSLKGSPVKQLAEQLGLDIYQPKTLRKDEALDLVKWLSPELIVVVAYGMILPQTILDIPSKGAVNLHASLLPRHRGASPINATIIYGDEFGGVTTMYMSAELDAGDVILQKKIPVGDTETAGELYERLKSIGASLLCETVERISAGNAPRIPQDAVSVTFCGLINKEMGLIDWSQPAVKVSRLIRGMNPWPGAYTFFEGRILKIHMAVVAQTSINLPCGSVDTADKENIGIVCGDSTIVWVTSVQLEGKRVMSPGEFINGHPLKRGYVFG